MQLLTRLMDKSSGKCNDYSAPLIIADETGDELLLLLFWLMSIMLVRTSKWLMNWLMNWLMTDEHINVWSKFLYWYVKTLKLTFSIFDWACSQQNSGQYRGLFSLYHFMINVLSQFCAKCLKQKKSLVIKSHFLIKC